MAYHQAAGMHTGDYIKDSERSKGCAEEWRQRLVYAEEKAQTEAAVRIKRQRKIDHHVIELPRTAEAQRGLSKAIGAVTGIGKGKAFHLIGFFG